MNILTASFTFDNTVILLVFGVIVLILGIYTLYNVKQMREKRTPPPWLVSESDIARIKNPADFCEAIRTGTSVLGVTCILYGAYTVFEFLFIRLYLAKVLGVAVLLVIVVWYLVRLRKFKDDYSK